MIDQRYWCYTVWLVSLYVLNAILLVSRARLSIRKEKVHQCRLLCIKMRIIVHVIVYCGMWHLLLNSGAYTHTHNMPLENSEVISWKLFGFVSRHKNSKKVVLFVHTLAHLFCVYLYVSRTCVRNTLFSWKCFWCLCV